METNVGNDDDGDAVEDDLAFGLFKSERVGSSSTFLHVRLACKEGRERKIGAT